LPENWNGRLLGLGGGGWAGNLYLSWTQSGPGKAADLGLPRGYATAQTDGGHSAATSRMPRGLAITPWPSPFATIDCYERAVEANGGANLRLFVVPGMLHCMNGPGADTFDPLTAMEQSVENGVVPETMVAKNRAAGFERPVCAWPKLPWYRSGDPGSAASFACRVHGN
jgi:hypothetical protein